MKRTQVKRVLASKPRTATEIQPYVKTFKRGSDEACREIKMLLNLEASPIRLLAPKILGYSKAKPGSYMIDLPDKKGTESVALSDGGDKLLTFSWNEDNEPYLQFLEVMLQIATFFAYSREIWHFSHNDLHMENILVRPCEKKMLFKFKVRGEEFTYLAKRVHVQIIDFEKADFGGVNQASTTEDNKHFMELWNSLKSKAPFQIDSNDAFGYAWSDFMKKLRDDPASSLNSPLFYLLHPRRTITNAEILDIESK